MCHSSSDLSVVMAVNRCEHGLCLPIQIQNDPVLHKSVCSHHVVPYTCIMVCCFCSVLLFPSLNHMKASLFRTNNVP